MKRKLRFSIPMFFALMLIAFNGWGQESVIYTTGFEADEGFTAGTTYNNTSIKYDGPTEQQWGTFYGTASTTGPISGSQSMQMRWYTSAPNNLGYTFSNFDLNHVTKVVFLASSTNNLNVDVSYSTDGGNNFIGNEIYTLSGTATEYTYNISSTGEFSNIRIRFKVSLPTPSPSGTSRLYIDDIYVYGITGGPIPPTISNIIQTPDSDITSTTTVGVSAEISEGDADISEVKLKWGTSTGSHPNEINMELPSKGTTYFTVSDIPVQADDTTVYYVIYAEDENGESATSPEQSYGVRDPRFAVLPFDETFDTDLGDCYTYSVSGDNYNWIHNSFGGNGFAQMSGFGSSELEEDWLILPGIDMSEYESVVLTFESIYRFHSSNEDHEFLLLYSVDYDGIGNPTLASWEELDFVRPTADAWDFIPSGDVILPETNEVLWLAFKYKYEDDYPTWRIDNIIIIDLGEPLLEANPSSLSGFSYFEDLGPSASQSFELTGISLHPDEGNILVNAGENFEVSVDDSSYDTSVELPYTDSELLAVDVFVRLKEGLAPGEYTEVITITGGGAVTETVALDGNVLPAPPGLPYAEDFSGFESAETLPEDWFVSNTTYNGNWGTGTAGGLRGNANVLGFQHTGGTGVFTASITLINNTGGVINELCISYIGMVERVDQGRSPEWTVRLNDTEIPELFYSTNDGVNEFMSVLLTDLEIGVNEVFTISWSSDRGFLSTGASKQIGIGNVTVNMDSTYAFDFETPEEVCPNTTVVVPVTFANVDPPGGCGYDAVRFDFWAVGPGTVTFTAKDSNDQYHTFVDQGNWGPAGGFTLPPEYAATTDWDMTFSEPGIYSITFRLLDVSNDKHYEVITQGVAEVMVYGCELCIETVTWTAGEDPGEEIIVIDISGTFACEEYSQVTVFDLLDLTGAQLIVNLGDDYLPEVGEKFEIIYFGERSGEFDMLRLFKSVCGKVTFIMDYGDNDTKNNENIIVLTVVRSAFETIFEVPDAPIELPE